MGICNKTEVVQCEAPELDALRFEENRAVLVLLDHCRETKRQECHARLAVGFLLIASLAFFSFFRMTAQDNTLSSKHVDATLEHGFLEGQTDRRQDDKPRAHLTLASVCSPAVEVDRRMHTLAWEKDAGLAGIYTFEYNTANQALVVQQDGHYNVYLQITYRIPHDFNCSLPRKQLISTVVRRRLSYNLDTELMMIYESMACDGQNMKSVFSAGVYELEKGTWLMVNVSDPELVDRSNDMKTYFGAYLI
ncbi:hypothetical protein AAFF_G00196980 [Aldrovandia affinis]|uniref:THD domain-containing protein n=1 Tax=Aldrovandia affinis TaxID=143900 RepID=A0AAD7RIW9_9TELE|nr:hypothetical protein AAFF_G00196980 [Aldrovandia affinis]